MLEADFQRFYGVDLRRECDEGLRRVVALLYGLPPEAAINQGTEEQWGLRESLLRVIAQCLGAKVEPANTLSGAPRPNKKRASSEAELAAFFGGLKGGE